MSREATETRILISLRGKKFGFLNPTSGICFVTPSFVALKSFSFPTAMSDEAVMRHAKARSARGFSPNREMARDSPFDRGKYEEKGKLLPRRASGFFGVFIPIVLRALF